MNRKLEAQLCLFMMTHLKWIYVFACTNWHVRVSPCTHSCMCMPHPSLLCWRLWNVSSSFCLISIFIWEMSLSRVTYRSALKSKSHALVQKNKKTNRSWRVQSADNLLEKLVLVSTTTETLQVKYKFISAHLSALWKGSLQIPKPVTQLFRQSGNAHYTC